MKIHTGPWPPTLLLVAVLGALAAQGCIIPPPEERLQTIGKAAPTALDPASIRVLVWNIYKSAEDGWWPDMQRLAGQHDLLLLQEGAWDEPLRAQYRQLAASGTLQLWLGVTFTLGDTATGTLLGSRSAPAGEVEVHHSAFLEPFGTPKSHQTALFRLAGRAERLLVLNVHGINFRTRPAPFAHQIRAVMDDARYHQGPVILAGDFNTWSDWREEHLFDQARRAGLTPVLPRSPEQAPEDGRVVFAGHYLDHAFVRGLRVAAGSARVLAGVGSSDHVPLSFEVATTDRAARSDEPVAVERP